MYIRVLALNLCYTPYSSLQTECTQKVLPYYFSFRKWCHNPADEPWIKYEVDLTRVLNEIVRKLIDTQHAKAFGGVFQRMLCVSKCVNVWIKDVVWRRESWITARSQSWNTASMGERAQQRLKWSQETGQVLGVALQDSTHKVPGETHKDETE